MVAGLVPAHVSAHPAWLLLCRVVAHLPLGTLALRLNALSAVCGALTALLLGAFVARLLCAMTREDAGGTFTTTPAVHAHNRRAAAAASYGGAVAAMAFAFSAACWSASTRLQFESFDALLLLVAGHLLLSYILAVDHRGRQSYALIAACLCGAGCVESLAFVVSAPVFLALALRVVLLTTKGHVQLRAQSLLALFLATIVGVLGNFLLLHHLAATKDAADASFPLAVFSQIVRNHRAMLEQALPHVGWIWGLLLSFVPAAIAGLGGRRAFQKRDAGAPAVHIVMTLAAVLCLANASFSPWGQAREGGRLPIMAYLAVAATTGYLFAYWRMLPASLERPENSRRHRLNAIMDSWLGSVMMCVPVAAVCLSPLANLSEASGRLGDFADLTARTVLARLGDRTWVASDGLLENHLLLAAQSEGRVLRVVNLAMDMDPARLRQIRAWIDADTHFAFSRVRMENAVALGASAFIDEWLRDDAAVNRTLFGVGVPEVWLRSGWRPVPEGYGFGGVRSLEELRRSDLLTRNRADWDRLAEILAPAPNLPPPLAAIRQTMRRQTSRAANDLGVLFEDLGQTNEARTAYRAAICFDHRNVCALLNLLGLPAIRDDPRQNIEKEVRALVDALNPRLPILAIILMYGEIRQPDVLATCGRAWAFLGQPALAQSQFDRATALAPAGLNARQLLANTLAVHGDAAAAAHAYRAAVESSTNNTTAMISLAAMCLCGGQTTEARQWLDRARKAGAPEPDWAVPWASLLLAEGQTNNALAYLRTFTEDNPGHMEAWAFEADILLIQQALSEVEQRVLPAMCMAAPHTDHFLIHIVRAHLLALKPPVDYRALRNSFLHAFALRPDLADVRDDLLRADIRSGNRNDLLWDVGETLRVNPGHALANYISGNILLEQGELQRAEDRLRRSLASRPSAVAFNDLAETLRRLVRLAEAENAAREAITLDPRCGQAWDTLGRILLDANRVAEAEKAIEQALALYDQDPRIHLNLARVRLAQKRPDDCRQILSHPGCDPNKMPADLRSEAEDLKRRAAQVRPAPTGK